MENIRKILICEDDEGISEALEIILSDAAYTVIKNDGKNCMDVIRQEKPDLLLLDLKLAGYSGKDILKAIRKDIVFSELPVIITSARPVLEIKEVAKSCGANGYVCKPFDITDLMEKVKLFI